MYKICIWMNNPSHYQDAFFSAITAREDVDLQVAYFKGSSSARVAEGWSDDYDYKPYEHSMQSCNAPEEMVEKLEGWKDCTHLICSYFSAELIDHFCRNNIKWCHWSEMPGIRLADLLGFRMNLYSLLSPTMLSMKGSDGRRIGKHALGAFGQGCLARQAFQRMGVPADKIEDLYYVPSPLEAMQPSEKVKSFAGDRKVFVSVGALCKRKGIDILLRSFAALKTDDWCLVLCGLDKENGIYQALAAKLGIEDRVLFVGAYPVERIAEVYAASDVFILSSRFDGWGAVLNEAASLGLPLIGTDMCGGSWHLIEQGKNGFRVKRQSVDELKDAMQFYISNPSSIEEHGRLSKKMYFETFTPERNAQRIVDALAKWEAK